MTSAKAATSSLRVLLVLPILTQLLVFALRGAGYVPAGGAVEYRPLDAASENRGGARRVLEPFQLCSQCRCCAADDRSNCTSMSCCFGISCNLPDKPYGVCAFVPKICDCASCT